MTSAQHAAASTHHRRRRPRAAALGVLLAVVLSALPSPAGGRTIPLEPATAQPDTVVETTKGAIRGRVDGDHLVFQKVPFAQPPVGELRFRAPRPVVPWTGIRDATRPAPGCAQTYPVDGRIRFDGSEDCLYLNVHVPRGARGRLPVMVFLHGGGFGGGNASLYDVRRVTRQGDVIVVTPNYRLGALGFLRHPRMRDRWAGNLGIADQQAALRWVRQNIRAFGGDTHNVTLWGESAGAYSVCAQLASPRARGLFDRAIMQSGPCGNDLLTPHRAERRARTAAVELGCTDPDRVLACLRQLPAEQIARQRVDDVRLTRFITNLPWLPVAHTAVLPQQPLDAARSGRMSHVPVLLGSTSQEMRTYIIDRYRLGLGLVSEAEYPTVLHAVFGDLAPLVLAEYPANEYDSPSAALAAALTDEGRGAGACRLLAFADAAARHTPVYLYEFAEPQPDDEQSVPGFPYGALHGADVPYFFDSYYRPSPQRPGSWQRLADTLIEQWTQFARTGRPADDWAPYQNGHGRRITQERSAEPVDLDRVHRCAFWDSAG